MATVNFYIEYRNSQRVHLPVNPTKIEVKTPSKSEIIDIVNLGETSIPKIPGLKEISFSSFIPVVNTGSYVQKDAPILSPTFYRDFFQAVQNQKEPINLIITGLGISHRMTVEEFDFSWEGSDEDMHYTISFKEYRKSTIKISTIGTSSVSATAQANNSARENTSKKVTIGSKVRVNGVLHRDSYGTGTGQTEKNAVRLVNFVKTGRACPYHITTLEGGWRGWVKPEAVEVIS